jgi:hypothetical protein
MPTPALRRNQNDRARQHSLDVALEIHLISLNWPFAHDLEQIYSLGQQSLERDVSLDQDHN